MEHCHAARCSSAATRGPTGYDTDGTSPTETQGAADKRSSSPLLSQGSWELPDAETNVQELLHPLRMSNDLVPLDTFASCSDLGSPRGLPPGVSDHTSPDPSQDLLPLEPTVDQHPRTGSSPPLSPFLLTDTAAGSDHGSEEVWEVLSLPSLGSCEGATEAEEALHAGHLVGELVLQPNSSHGAPLAAPIEQQEEQGAEEEFMADAFIVPQQQREQSSSGAKQGSGQLEQQQLQVQTQPTLLANTAAGCVVQAAQVPEEAARSAGGVAISAATAAGPIRCGPAAAVLTARPIPGLCVEAASGTGGSGPGAAGVGGPGGRLGQDLQPTKLAPVGTASSSLLHAQDTAGWWLQQQLQAAAAGVWAPAIRTTRPSSRASSRVGGLQLCPAGVVGPALPRPQTGRTPSPAPQGLGSSSRSGPNTPAARTSRSSGSGGGSRRTSRQRAGNKGPVPPSTVPPAPAAAKGGDVLLSGGRSGPGNSSTRGTLLKSRGTCRQGNLLVAGGGPGGPLLLLRRCCQALLTFLLPGVLAAVALHHLMLGVALAAAAASRDTTLKPSPSSSSTAAGGSAAGPRVEGLRERALVGPKALGAAYLLRKPMAWAAAASGGRERGSNRRASSRGRASKGGWGPGQLAAAAKLVERAGRPMAGHSSRQRHQRTCEGLLGQVLRQRGGSGALACGFGSSPGHWPGPGSRREQHQLVKQWEGIGGGHTDVSC